MYSSTRCTCVQHLWLLRPPHSSICIISQLRSDPWHHCTWPAQADLAGVKSDNERLRARLDESKEQLTSNEQMIRWLNQQVTEAQLSMTTAVPGSSRYTFRPASTIATPAAGLLGAAPASTYPTR